MNGWVLPDDVLREAPVYTPRPYELADLELLLSGAYAPLVGFLGRADLAALARRVLDTPRLARIVRRRRAVLPFPIKGGRLHLSNNNPLLQRGYPGVLGVKTGYTNEAGRCLVAAARRNGVRLAAIVLHSPDPGTQARQLLSRGFRVAT